MSSSGGRLAAQVLVDPTGKPASPVGSGGGTPGLGGEVLTEVEQGLVHVGIGRQPTLPAGALPGGGVRLPVQGHRLLALTVASQGRLGVDGIGRGDQRLAIVVEALAEHAPRIARVRVRVRGG